MRFNATYKGSEFVVDISRDLKLSFPEVDMEYELAFRAMGGNATPVEEFTEYWNDHPVVVVASYLGLPWEVLIISMLNHAEHVIPQFKSVSKDENLARLIEESVDMARSALMQWGVDLDYTGFFWKTKKLGDDLLGLCKKFGKLGLANGTNAYMAHAMMCLLKYMASTDKESLFILGSSKVRSVVRNAALYRERGKILVAHDHRIDNQVTAEMHWQVRRTLDVAAAFQKAEQETPAGEQVNLGRVMGLAGETK